MLEGAISCDVDTLASIYRGFGLTREGGYTGAEFQRGLERFDAFLDEFGVRSTLFVVGEDLKRPSNRQVLSGLVGRGHEVANHTLTHAQGFRHLTPAEQESELAGMEVLCEEAVGYKPRGFRSPGWNVSDVALPILRRRGYLYDSSLFPSALNPLLKGAYWLSSRAKPRAERSTLGQLSYTIAPVRPYQTSTDSLRRPGQSGLVELPLTVTPGLRLPFSATFLLGTGWTLFRASYEALRRCRRPIQFMFHVSDFVDYGDPEFAGQVPSGRRVYVPRALRTPLDIRLELFRRAMALMARDYEFRPLDAWAESVLAGGGS